VAPTGPGCTAARGGVAALIAAVAGSLALLALVDGACAGFRSSVGRSGLISHRASDRRAARRGATVAAILLTPAIAVTCAAILLDHSRSRLFLRAGEAMLDVYAPYALAVLAALAAYATLGWRKRYLASAVILGPFTLLRPVVVIAGAGLAIGLTRDVAVTITAIFAILGVLAVEPVADRLWYASRQRGDLGG
jgi:hypothetical protein